MRLFLMHFSASGRPRTEVRATATALMDPCDHSTSGGLFFEDSNHNKYGRAEAKASNGWHSHHDLNAAGVLLRTPDVCGRARVLNPDHRVWFKLLAGRADGFTLVSGVRNCTRSGRLR